MVTPSGEIGLKKDRTPTLLFIHHFDITFCPLKLKSQIYTRHPLQQIDAWENNIRERNAQLDNDPDIAIPRFEDTALPLVDTWVGICDYDRRTIIADILSSELPVLTFLMSYQDENSSILR